MKGGLYTKLRNLWYGYLSELSPQKGVKVKIKQPTLFLGAGEIVLGDRVRIGYFPSPFFFSHYTHIEARGPGSRVSIGANTIINNGCRICVNAGGGLSIGKDCLIGVNVSFMDSDFHSLAPEKRRTGTPAIKPIMVEDNVFIGNDVTVCKGVTIGENSVVGTGSVVTKSVPANVVVAGVPAQIVSSL